MRVRVLGSAAGGGFPQWNCRCGTCEAARAGVRARPRTQSSLAIRGAEGPWFLVNASPDLRQQLETLHAERVDGVRAPPIAGVLLTDAEIDHTAGLLLLRESTAPLRVFGDGGRRARAADGYPVLRCWSASAASTGTRSNRERAARGLEPDGRAFAWRRPPRYADVEVEASGFVFRDARPAASSPTSPGSPGSTTT